ncbi:F-box/kelch-repeat protein At3g06240-like [Papaver somniferum]|uniref:F-box/kelch-repeat protein At3g06240-like n=1 Tax=Papaver somniferum TaxID=3469 RepID=UPI000E6FB90A|nr:F-box/kelch-repeat protein At3g06240-like [Papaver somniferum]
MGFMQWPGVPAIQFWYYWFLDNYCLLNLATREYKMIVVPQDPDELCICGLAYDCNSDDYKLIVSDESYDKISAIQVYSLASDSWKSIPTCIPYTFPYRSYIPESGVFFNGYLHWLALNQSISKVIVSFDVSDERFKEVQLPNESWKHGCQAIFLESLGVPEGRLCVLVKKDYFGPDARLEFWEMLDYGVEESWTRRYIITHEIIMMDNNFRMMWSFKNGKFLFLSSGTLALYDPEDGSVRGLNSKHDIYFMDGASYFESLVSLKSGTYFRGDDRVEELREP